MFSITTWKTCQVNSGQRWRGPWFLGAPAAIPQLKGRSARSLSGAAARPETAAAPSPSKEKPEATGRTHEVRVTTGFGLHFRLGAESRFALAQRGHQLHHRWPPTEEHRAICPPGRCKCGGQAWGDQRRLWQRASTVNTELPGQP